MSQTRNRVLEFLTAKPRPDGEASRSNRRRTSSALIELSWLDQGKWQASKGRLIDISRGGASLMARQTPTTPSLARLRFLEGEGSPWVEVKILGIEPQNDDDARVRVHFEGHCPSFLLRLAVLGETQKAEAADHEPHFSWRSSDPS